MLIAVASQGTISNSFILYIMSSVLIETQENHAVGYHLKFSGSGLICGLKDPKP